MEAHAADTWPMGFEVCYNQTSSLEERSAVARDFIRDNKYEFPIRIDAPEQGDPFNTLFAAWPLRFYVIRPEDRKLIYICEPFGDIIAVSALENYLEWYLQ